MTSDDYKRLADELGELIPRFRDDQSIIDEAVKVIRAASVEAGEPFGYVYNKKDFDTERYDHFWKSEGVPVFLHPAPSASVGAMREACNRILPYLRWTISDESPGHHPTMRSAVAEFEHALAAANQTDGGGKLAPAECPQDRSCACERKANTTSSGQAVPRSSARASDTPPAPQAVETASVDEVARTMWRDGKMDEAEDRCDMDIHDLPQHHPVWSVARALIAKFKMEGR